MAVPSRSRRGPKRRGAILVLAVILTSLMCAFVAFAVDMGYVYVARTELQRSADAAAIASAWELLDDSRFGGDDALARVEVAARVEAGRYAALNRVGNKIPLVDLNVANNPQGDVVFGRLMEGGNMSTYGNAEKYNAVKVSVRRSQEINGEVPLFFARILGFNSAEVTAEATATFGDGISGFRPTERTGNTTLIPFALHVDVWRSFLSGDSGDDDWQVDLETDGVWRGSDGIPELNIYPNDTGSAGNFGTLNIGDTNNSTNVLRAQIANGISQADLASHGGQMGLGPCSADPGISGGIKHGLKDAVGKPRTIALYDTVSGVGSNAMFNIVGFAGIRIVDFQMEGRNGHVTVQPAVVVDDSALSGAGTSYSVYQPVTLAK